MRRLLKSESGVALTLAIVTLSFLFLTGTTFVYYVVSNAGNAEYSVDNTRALHLAEAGDSYARSKLWQAQTDGTDLRTDSIVGSGTLTLDDGTVTYTGTFDDATDTWTLTGTGTYSNPTGAAAPIVRTVSSQVRVVDSIAFDPAWLYLFADNATTCTTLQNTLTIDADVYVRGDLCMANSALITADLVRVRGKLQIKNSASIGQLASPVQTVEVGGGCRYPWSGAYVSPCGAAQRVYRVNFSSTPPNIDKPPNLVDEWYVNAKPGPNSPTCTTGSFPGTFDTDTTLNRSNPQQNLFPASAYDCQVKSGGTVLGRIAYTPGTPGTFIIEGVVFFDGKVRFQADKEVVYQGRGSIYASDEIRIEQNVWICGVATCDGTWNPEENLLVFVGGATAADGVVIENDAVYQGSIYVVNDYVQNNEVVVWGPVIADELKIANDGQNYSVPYSTLAPGQPSSGDATGSTLENVDGSYTTD
jgi:hypothetical protein